MLILIILSWGKDLIMQPVESVEAAHDLKRRLDKKDTDFIIYEVAFLCPIKFDIATRQLSEEEQLEGMMMEVMPQLEAEGRVIKKGRKYVPLARC